MANYYFRLRDTSATNPTPIILFAQINGNRIKCKTNESILPSEWDATQKKPKRKKENKVLTDRLVFLESVANDTYLYFRDTLKVAEPLSSDFQSKFYELSGIDTTGSKTLNTEQPNLFQFIDSFVQTATNRVNLKTGKPLSRITIRNFIQLKNQLQRFSKQVCRVDFDRVDRDFYDKFIDFLFKQGYSTNTVGRYIKDLKTILNDATERGINTNYSYKSKKFAVLQVATDSIYLTESEINELHELDLSKYPKLDRVRDLFLVGCFTGLRFSDFTNIKPENIKGDFIEITTQKTNDSVVIPIHPKLRQIMAKYYKLYINSLPPAISNQKMNRYLKEVCGMVKSLNELVTDKKYNGKISLQTEMAKYLKVSTHTARRSFATNQYNKGFPASLLMKITGHRTETAFYKYIRVTPKESAQRLSELWKKEYSHLKVV